MTLTDHFFLSHSFLCKWLISNFLCVFFIFIEIAACIYLFSHSFNKCLLSTYYMPDIVNTEHVAVVKGRWESLPSQSLCSGVSLPFHSHATCLRSNDDLVIHDAVNNFFSIVRRPPSFFFLFYGSSKWHNFGWMCYRCAYLMREHRQILPMVFGVSYTRISTLRKLNIYFIFLILIFQEIKYLK